MPNPAYFIALPMSVNLRKRYLFYLYMLVIFKIVMLSVSLKQSVTMHKPFEIQIVMSKSDTLITLLEKNFCSLR